MSRGTWSATLGLTMTLMMPAVGSAQDEPVIWPTIRYGWPEKLSGGVAVQPPFGGLWSRLVGSAIVGTGGAKVGLGLGRFGTKLMVGWALQATVLRTTADPLGAPPHRTYVGAEAQVMAANISIKAGPAVGVSGPADEERFRLNVSVGYGF